MSYIGTNEYVIEIMHSGADPMYYGGMIGGKPITTPSLISARKFLNIYFLRDELEKLPIDRSYRILEIMRCPKCKKEFTEHPAISREDNETEICPSCGLREAMQAVMGEKGTEADA